MQAGHPLRGVRVEARIDRIRLRRLIGRAARSLRQSGAPAMAHTLPACHNRIRCLPVSTPNCRRWWRLPVLQSCSPRGQPETRRVPPELQSWIQSQWDAEWHHGLDASVISLLTAPCQ